MIKEIVNESKAYYCVECRKCSSACPVTRVYGKFSPASIVERSLIGIEDELVYSNDIWKCLTCGICEEICPSGVDFLSFIRKVREIAMENKNFGIPAHENIFGKLPILFEKNDLNFSIKNVEIDEKSKILYFAGCLPLYDVFFENIGFSGISIAENTIKILNYFDIAPAVLFSCCGHDALWNGNNEIFEKMKKKNMEKIKNFEKIIFSCPECYRTFKYDYKAGIEMMHISEFLKNSKIEGNLNKECTFHDSCRLGRHLGIYEEPREALRNAGYEIKEMSHSKEKAICCSTSAWMACDWKAEQIRKERLLEAEQQSKMLITTCPKCKIHFLCTMSHENYELEVKDFVEAIGEAI
ncbi:MAG: (Fe-S)-binding protein [Thermoplasmatales archaeon]|nr:(Fe-S)-binding protein [Thermoplasmatales archaeon]